MRFRNRVAVVTGSSRGSGRCIAERLAAEGADVVICSRHLEALDSPVAAIRALGREPLAVAADVSDPRQVDRLFEETVRRFGGLDILVNNAGAPFAATHFLEMNEAHWDTVIDNNLKSVYLCSHWAAKLMVEQKRPGCIISISSFSAARSHRNRAAYDASKGGIEAFTRAIALDLAPFGIRANTVAPGAIYTERHANMDPASEARRAEPVPLGRVGYPNDIAGAVLFLASDDASYVTGQSICVDGGMTAQLRPAQSDLALPESVRALLKR